MNSRMVTPLFGLLIALSGALAHAQSFPKSGDKTAGNRFFTNGVIHHFDIQINRQGMDTLRRDPRADVPATVRFQGQVFSNVAIHLKGVATFRPIDDQPSLTLNFTKFGGAQRVDGLRKIHLNNGKEDPSFLCEALSAEMFARAGMPAPRVVHGRTRLNGRDLGAYVIKEGFTKDFLARHFTDTSGNLYDSGFRREVNEPLELLQGKEPKHWADLKQLAMAASIGDPERRWIALGLSLDTNSFARYLAMQSLISNWDGYAFYRNNYRIYNDPTASRLHFFPHGMDQTFSRPTMALMPLRWEGAVARSYVETRQGRALFQRELGRLYTNCWDTTYLVKRVDEMATLLRPIFAEQPSQVSAEHYREVAALRRRIQERGLFLERQFANTNWMNPRIYRRATPIPIGDE